MVLSEEYTTNTWCFFASVLRVGVLPDSVSEKAGGARTKIYGNSI